jgi:hypothetical protein
LIRGRETQGEMNVPRLARLLKLDPTNHSRIEVVLPRRKTTEKQRYVKRLT